MMAEEREGVLVILNSIGQIIKVNDKFDDVFGFPADELTLRPIQDLIVGNVSSELPLFDPTKSKPTTAELKTNWNTSIEAVIIPLPADNIVENHYEFLITFLKAPSSEVFGLSQSELFKEVFELAAVGVVLVSPEGKILKANSSFQSYLGYSEQALRDLNYQEFTHPDDLEIDVENYRQLQAGEIDHYNMEKRYISKKGRVFWVDLTVSLMRDRQGKMMYAIAIVQDIDQRKKVIIELDQRKSRLEKAVAGAKEAVWHWLVVKTEKQWWSPAFAEILEYPRNYLKPSYSTFLTLLHPDDKIPVENAVALHFSEDIPFDIDYRLKKYDGDYKWVNAKGHAERDSQGHVVEMIGIISDIDELKKAKGLLEERNLALEHSNEELENFAYVASHDLQEPLRTISSFLQLFKLSLDVPVNDEALSYLETVHSASLRMRKLIEDLLEYSRVGKQLSHETIDLQPLLEEIRADLAAQLESQNGEILVHAAVSIEGDRYSYYRLFKNLVSNGLKFSKPGIEPKVTVTASTQADEIWIQIADEGIGIDSLYHERIFEVFKRLHARDEYPGSGIGLSICKKIVDLHQGKIWVKSQPGQGAVFHISLPKHIHFDTL